jgi:hypothetical protein
MPVITQKLPWDTRTAILRKNAALDMRESEAWGGFLSAVEQRKLSLIEQLASQKVSTNPGDYERILGEIRGLDTVDGILEGIIQFGRKAEIELRDIEESART